MLRRLHHRGSIEHSDFNWDGFSLEISYLQAGLRLISCSQDLHVCPGLPGLARAARPTTGLAPSNITPAAADQRPLEQFRFLEMCEGSALAPLQGARKRAY